MPEVFRTRDVIVFKKGDAHAVTVSSSLVGAGWPGGQGVQWFNTGRDELAVTTSDGLPHGFLLWGSDETPDQFTSMTRSQPAYQYAVLGFGGWVIATKTFERFTLASRLSPPNVPIVYQAQDKILFSLRGLFTKEDEWTLSGDPRAPNGNIIGVVIRPPSVLTDGYLTLQLRI
mgnify:CR=1 FL=1